MSRSCHSHKAGFFLFLLCCCPVFLLAQLPQRGVSVSPYPVSIRQPDGSSLRILGKLDGGIAYTETEDGYTVLKNKRKLYVYARPGRQGRLVCSRQKATDAASRTGKEKTFLSSLPRHLRHEPPYRDTLLRNKPKANPQPQ